ncbi:polysaccharide biosynthesis/export family protein [Sphingorhabdus sp. Alg231-15]|uniref:polysaccharide biosynthesis/export family protein n=1 Tax=Sphingorhabdus sp. Alg231-15 TaxID=1922222 RepID=UPI00307B9399
MFRKTMVIGFCAALAGGCATMERPANLDTSQYAPQQQVEHSNSAPRCISGALPSSSLPHRQIASEVLIRKPDLLSSGDRIQLKIAGDEESLSRIYVLAGNGSVTLDGRHSISLVGLSIVEAEQTISRTLVANGLIRGLRGSVRLQLLELGGVSVAVNGAVFQPGMVRVGQRSAELRGVHLDNNNSGDRNITRSLTAAIRAAGGVRPDADLSAVYVVSGNSWSRVDLTGAIDGDLIDDISLSSNDRIIVGSTNCFQSELVKPSRVTAPGIRVFMSNLSRPAASNASSSIGRETTSLPYGTRLSQAMVSANCVGGSAMNAARKVVLMSRNPINGQSVVIQRSVEKLVRQDNRDQRDPYLMPGDSLACYDSFAMNVRDVISLVGETASPYFLLKNVD